MDQLVADLNQHLQLSGVDTDGEEHFATMVTTTTTVNKKIQQKNAEQQQVIQLLCP